MSGKTALLFAGQGAQYVGMGRDWAETEPEARGWFDRAQQVLGYDLARICFEGPEEVLTRTEHAQPGIFLVSWVAWQLLRRRCPDLRVDAVAGLSLGEFTALTVAGVFGFEDGLRVVQIRGRWMQHACETTQGGMAAIIGLDEETTRQVCEEAGVSMANLNCPGQIVISGEQTALERAGALARARGARKVVPLQVAGAYHSPLMAAAQPALREALESVPMAPPTMPVLSNVTARPHEDVPTIRARLVEQVTAPVLWEAGMRYLLEAGFDRFIELGPGTVLSGFLKRIRKDVQVLNVSDTASLAATVQAIQHGS
ncbi:ACP S-malonyltransferase [Limisphaera sp. VF-2]|jgi:[acyl-carrier-protein] S-malonyltransferase|uniref:ACP S-malonyltransferase n=1 Tax=Limisphaera sp. VF-2 TaxID=3400418 RepID=UPI0017570D91